MGDFYNNFEFEDEGGLVSESFVPEQAGGLFDPAKRYLEKRSVKKELDLVGAEAGSKEEKWVKVLRSGEKASKIADNPTQFEALKKWKKDAKQKLEKDVKTLNPETHKALAERLDKIVWEGASGAHDRASVELGSLSKEELLGLKTSEMVITSNRGFGVGRWKFSAGQHCIVSRSFRLVADDDARFFVAFRTVQEPTRDPESFRIQMITTKSALNKSFRMADRKDGSHFSAFSLRVPPNSSASFDLANAKFEMAIFSASAPLNFRIGGEERITLDNEPRVYQRISDSGWRVAVHNSEAGGRTFYFTLARLLL